MNRADLPEILKLSERLAAAIERAVARSPRAFRYTHGSVIRVRAIEVSEGALWAWQKIDRRTGLLEALSDKIDGLKLALRIGKRAGVFSSSAEFADIFTMARALGRQCGGWLKHAKGLNPERQQHGVQERSQTLSTRAASMLEANP